MKTCKRETFLAIAYWLVYGFVYAGWFFHRSEVQTGIFPFSSKYLAFACAMSVFFLLPFFFRVLLKMVSGRSLLFALIPAAAVLWIVYLVSAARYYATQKHPFDPYRQMGPVRLSSEELREKKPGTIRILFLGGSATECSALSYEQRYPTLVRKILQKKYPGGSIEIMNAGMAWYASKHSLINYVTYYRIWKPDIVVVMHAMNDLYRSFSPPEYAMGEYDELWTHFYGPSIQGANPPAFYEHLWIQLKSASVFGFPVKTITEAWYSHFRNRKEDYGIEKFLSLPKYEHYLRTLLKEIQNDGAEPVLVTEPSLFKETLAPAEKGVLRFAKEVCATQKGWVREYPSAASMQHAMEIYNQTAARIGQEEKVPVADAAAKLPRDLAHFTDDVHYTALGASDMAELVAQTILTTVISRSAATRDPAASGFLVRQKSADSK